MISFLPVNMVKIKVGRLSEFNSSPCFFIIIIEKAPSDIEKPRLNSHNPAPIDKSCLPCLLLGLGTRSLWGPKHASSNPV